MRKQVLKRREQFSRAVQDKNKQVIALESKLINGSVLKLTKSSLPIDYDSYKKDASKPKPPPANLDFLKQSKIKPQQVTRVMQSKQNQKNELQKTIVRLQRIIEKQLERHKVQQSIVKDRQKHLSDYLFLKKKIEQHYIDKDSYIVIEYEKDMQSYKKDLQKFQKERIKFEEKINQLNKKLDAKNVQIGEANEKIKVLRKQVKEAWDKVQVQEQAIIQLNKLNAGYKQQIIEVKLRNKNLEADNKVVLVHLDKLLKQKNQNQMVDAKTVFEERERRVIQSLYKKNYSTTINNPQNKDIMPSYRNQLSNKVKYEELYEQFLSYKAQSTAQIHILKTQLQNKSQQYDAQVRLLEKLQQNYRNLQQINKQQKRAYDRSIDAMNMLEQRIQILNEQNQYLKGEEDMRNKYYTDSKLFNFKTKIGSIVQINSAKKTVDTNYSQT